MKSLFRFLENGQKFQAGGDILIKRKENKAFPTTCDGCEGVQYANAILEGVTIVEATRLTFVHCCPNDYVWVE